jgi:hypothetical protein
MPRDHTKVFKNEDTFISLEALREDILRAEEGDPQKPIHMREIGTNNLFDASPFLSPDFLGEEETISNQQLESRDRFYRLLNR